MQSQPALQSDAGERTYAKEDSKNGRKCHTKTQERADARFLPTHTLNALADLTYDLCIQLGHITGRGWGILGVGFR